MGGIISAFIRALQNFFVAMRLVTIDLSARRDGCWKWHAISGLHSNALSVVATMGHSTYPNKTLIYARTCISFDSDGEAKWRRKLKTRRGHFENRLRERFQN